MGTVHDIVTAQDKNKNFEYCLPLIPSSWEYLNDLPDFQWISVRFNEDNLENIPDQPGIYSFVINPRYTNHPHRFLGYIGSTERTLNQRYREYLKEKNNPKGRPKILRLLNKWDGYIDFCYITELEEIIDVESRLNDAFQPPYNSDFSGEVNRIQNAF